MPVAEDVSSALGLYVRSIEEAEDLALAEKVWETTDAASLIWPLGWERGWRNIRKNFYETVMAGRFRDRRLSIVGEPVLRQFDGFCLLEFAWDFAALSREDGAKVATRGRESQVWLVHGGAPRLAHVHYSLRME
ncbi:MAG: nuclear transport factor 2 family protein [Desulfovibrio sp.]|nr:nuclear transport factor 2 family protein [Desulfovibrio sp.]